jgi:hypothetical protein
MPTAPCYEVFASNGYGASVANFSQISLAGYAIALTIGIAG